MSVDLESPVEGSGWDRTFLDISSKMSEPFCAAWHLLCFRLVAPLDPQKFENCTTVANEVAIRILIGSGAAVGAFHCFARNASSHWHLSLSNRTKTRPLPRGYWAFGHGINTRQTND